MPASEEDGSSSPIVSLQQESSSKSSKFIARFALVVVAGFMANSPARGQSWTVTKPVQGDAYAINHIDVDATVSWMMGMTAVSNIDVEVWVNNINRTGTGGNLSFPATGSQYSFKVTGFQTVQTQNVNSSAVVKLIAKDAVGNVLSTKEVTILGQQAVLVWHHQVEDRFLMCRKDA